MERGMNVFYGIQGNLYVNLTNRCSCACTFCLRNAGDGAHGSDTLWLAHEPTLDEVLAMLDEIDLRAYHEVVFCGYGEPTCAWEVLLPLAREIKRRSDARVRINTNGQGSLIVGRNIALEFKGAVDALSISLNTPDPATYQHLTRSQFGEEAYPAMLAFAREASQQGIEVTMTTVATTLTAQEEAACARICEELGAAYRIRPWVE